MQYLVLIRRRIEAFTAEEFEPWFAGEMEQVRKLYIDGFVRQIWRRGDMPGAVLMVEAETEFEVRQKLQTLPMLQNDMLDVTELVPLQPYPAFGPQG